MAESGGARETQSIAGDTRTEQALAQRLYRPLHQMLRVRRVPAADCDDLVQETLLIVLARFRNQALDPIEDVDAFACATCRNLLIGQWRKSGRQESLNAERESLQVVVGKVPEQALGHEQMATLVRESVSHMSQPRDREILLQHYLHDQDKSELCQRFQLTSAHFDRILYNARQRLRTLLLRAGVDTWS